MTASRGSRRGGFGARIRRNLNAAVGAREVNTPDMFRQQREAVGSVGRDDGRGGQDAPDVELPLRCQRPCGATPVIATTQQWNTRSVQFHLADGRRETSWHREAWIQRRAAAAIVGAGGCIRCRGVQRPFAFNSSTQFTTMVRSAMGFSGASSGTSVMRNRRSSREISKWRTAVPVS